MNARAHALILLMFGAALTVLGLSDGLLRFVRPYLRPYVIVAGVAILGLAAWSLAQSFRAERHPDATELDAHGHGVASRAAWLALAPVVAILVISPPSLGAYSASRQAPPAAQTGQKHSPLPAGASPAALSMFDFFQRAIGDQGQTLAGHQIRLTGFVLRDGSGAFVLTRLVITCCAADALPINVAVETSVAMPAAGAWLSVVGTFDGVTGAKADVPVLKASMMTSIREPANPYD